MTHCQYARQIDINNIPDDAALMNCPDCGNRHFTEQRRSSHTPTVLPEPSREAVLYLERIVAAWKALDTAQRLTINAAAPALADKLVRAETWKPA